MEVRLPLQRRGSTIGPTLIFVNPNPFRDSYSAHRDASASLEHERLLRDKAIAGRNPTREVLCAGGDEVSPLHHSLDQEVLEHEEEIVTVGRGRVRLRLDPPQDLVHELLLAVARAGEDVPDGISPGEVMP